MKLKWIILIFIASWTNIAIAEAIYRDTEGNPVRLSPIKNQWIVINYWASWCSSCIDEIPELNNFNQHRDKNIFLYGVNYDELPLPDLKQAVKQSHITFPVLANNPSDVFHLEEITVLPVTFIINPKGEVVKKIMGPSTESSLLKTIHDLQKTA